jgi:DNA-3-methyladenine glycosylase I
MKKPFSSSRRSRPASPSPARVRHSAGKAGARKSAVKAGAPTAFAVQLPDGAGPLELVRCPWPGTDPLYITYHDQEWGVPEWDGRALYEKLTLDGFQAGLSWITILRKREAFRSAFDGFVPQLVARYDSDKIAELMNNPGIVRHRAKIEAAVAGARAWLPIEEKTGFAQYIWGFVDGRPIRHVYRAMRDIPAATELSRTIAKDLRGRGFGFCGPTVVYAFMQACGLVNDHLIGCYRHAECQAMR